MWHFEDRSGNRWEVALGRESWGVLCALFVPKADGDVRQVPLEANNERAAMSELDGLEVTGWQDLLDRSQLRP